MKLKTKTGIINFELSGEGDKTMVFIHGAGGDLRGWDFLIHEVHKKGYQTLVIDLRGHGLSKRKWTKPSYKVSKFADDIHKVLTHLGLKQVVLTGHCFGGMVVMNYASRYPENVSHLVIMSTTEQLRGWPRIVFSRYNPLTQLANLLLLFAAPKKKLRHRKYVLGKNIGDWSVRAFFTLVSHTSIKSWVYTLQAMISYNGKKDLKRLKMPVLIIHGGHDKVFPMSDVEKMRTIIKNSKLIVVKENHRYNLLIPDRVAKFLDDFLKNKL